MSYCSINTLQKNKYNFFCVLSLKLIFGLSLPNYLGTKLHHYFDATDDPRFFIIPILLTFFFCWIVTVVDDDLVDTSNIQSWGQTSDFKRKKLETDRREHELMSCWGSLFIVVFWINVFVPDIFEYIRQEMKPESNLDIWSILIPSFYVFTFGYSYWTTVKKYS